MTVLNFAFNEQRFFAVIDSAASCPVDHRRVGTATKLFPLTHMRLIVAGHGTHLVLSQFASWASFTSTARNVIELATAATPVLRNTWSALEPARRAAGSDNHSAAILIAGFDDSECMQVAYLSSHVDFEPVFLRTGVYLSPSPKPGIDNVTAAEPATADAVAPPSPPPPSEPWADQTQRVVRAVRAQQAEQSPGFIGGRLWGTLLTVDSIFQSEIMDLDEPVPHDYTS